MVKLAARGAVTVLSVEAPLAAEVGAQLVERVRQIPRGGRPQVVIDLAAAPLIDSAGCEAVLDAADLVEGLGGGLHLASACPLVADVFLATGVAERLPRFEGLQEAVAAFGR